MQINRSDTAVVLIDPQNEVLSESGLAWPLVRKRISANSSAAAYRGVRSSRGQRNPANGLTTE
jgi:hypothetical protein